MGRKFKSIDQATSKDKKKIRKHHVYDDRIPKKIKTSKRPSKLSSENFNEYDDID